MTETKTDKYNIECIDKKWLTKPGLVIYVEKDDDPNMNQCIMANLTELEKLASSIGYKFIYLPVFLSLCENDLYKFMTGKKPIASELINQHQSLVPILGSDIVGQLQGPSLLFSGLTEDNAYELYKLQSAKKVYWNRKNHKETYYELNKLELKAIFDDYTDVHKLFNVNACKSEKDDNGIEGDIIFRSIKDEFTNLLSSSDCLLESEFSIKSESDVVDFPSSFGKITLSEEEKIVRDRAQKLIQKLLDEGVSEEAIWAFFAPKQTLSTIKITKRYRIILPEYDNMEIPLPAIQKAVYFLFLKHPEGINFKDMADYRNELFNIYRKLAERGTTDKLAGTVDDLVNPLSNAMNEKCSRIKNMFRYYLTENLAKHYYISGDKGESKHIDIETCNILWMKEI